MQNMYKNVKITTRVTFDKNVLIETTDAVSVTRIRNATVSYILNNNLSRRMINQSCKDVEISGQVFDAYDVLEEFGSVEDAISDIFDDETYLDDSVYGEYVICRVNLSVVKVIKTEDGEMMEGDDEGEYRIGDECYILDDDMNLYRENPIENNNDKIDFILKHRGV